MFRDIVDIIYPRKCPMCRDIVVPKGRLVCESCSRTDYYITEPLCKRCGKRIENEEIEYCFDCTIKNFSFEAGRAVFQYSGAIKQAVMDFKYNGWKDNSDFFVNEIMNRLGAWINEVNPEILIPIPIHRSRKRFRGYNQAELLAKGISEKTGIPYRMLLKRSRKTLPQKQLSDTERQKNLLKAFSVDIDELNSCVLRSGHLPQRVILVDDIYTTGSTIEACSRALKRAGVDHIYYVAVCIGKGY